MEDVDAIGVALETKLKAFPGMPIHPGGKQALAWENTNYEPETGVPYLSTFLLFAEPDDVGYKDSPFIQRGYMQLGLHFPTNKGPGEARAMAKALRRYFFRSLSLIAGGITTVIEKTPTISGGAVEEGRYVVRIIVRFYAEIQPSP